MSSADISHQGIRSRPLLWFCVAAGILFVLLANAHLVFVAITSDPACVDHVRLGEAGGGEGQYSAARSSCAPD